MMKSWATRGLLPLLDAVAHRTVAWIVMAEDLPDPGNRVTLTSAGGTRTSRVAKGTRRHRLLHRRAKRLLRGVGYDVVATQSCNISMNSHMCGTSSPGPAPVPACSMDTARLGDEIHPLPIRQGVHVDRLQPRPERGCRRCDGIRNLLPDSATGGAERCPEDSSLPHGETL